MDKWDAAPMLLQPAMLARIISSCGTAAFGEAILETATSITPVEEIYMWDREPGESPRELAAASCYPDQRARIDSYAGRFFRSDPINLKADQNVSFMQIVEADAISFPEYRRICFDRPLFHHKVSFGTRVERRLVVLNFYLRQSTREPDQLIAALAGIASAAIAAAMLDTSDDTVLRARKRIEGRLRARFPELSNQESAVLALIALGQQRGRIADSLNISETSVATYRNRAMAKLGHADLSAVLAQVI